MKLVLKTAPAREPVYVSDVQIHCRLDSTDPTENSLLEALITAARSHVEMITGRALITQTWQLLLDEWPATDRIMLPKPPLQSVAAVTYVDSDDTTNTLDASTYDLELAHSVPPVLNPYVSNGYLVLGYGEDWPSDTLRPAAPITVEFVCGYGEAEAVPVAMKQAMLLLVGHWYENRTVLAETRFAASLAGAPFAVEALLAPFRTWS